MQSSQKSISSRALEAREHDPTRTEKLLALEPLTSKYRCKARPVTLDKKTILARKRRLEVLKLFRFRHGPEVDEIDDVGPLLSALLCAMKAEDPDDLRERFLKRCRVLVRNFDENSAEMFCRQNDWRAHDLSGSRCGKLVDLKWKERLELRIQTIDPNDLSEEQFQQKKRHLKRKNDRLRAAAKRRRNGAKTRSEYEDNSLSKMKPWAVEGISRAQWYRKQKER